MDDGLRCPKRLVVGDLAFHGRDNTWRDQERLCRGAHCRVLLCVVIDTHAGNAEEWHGQHDHDDGYWLNSAHLSPLRGSCCWAWRNRYKTPIMTEFGILSKGRWVGDDPSFVVVTSSFFTKM